MSGRLYRDTSRAWVGGVLAGVADSLQVPVGLVRLFSLPLLLTPLLPLTIITYVIALVVLPIKPPAPPPANPEREAFRESLVDHPSATFGQVRHRFREIEHRIRRIEAYVTSPDYEIDQELRQRR